MAFFRGKRHHKPLKLPLHQPHLSAQLQLQQLFISPSSPDSPVLDALSDLEKLEVIGHGNGGTVYRVRHRGTSAVYALKVVHLRLDSLAVQLQATREADILRRVDSPFVVRCHSVFSTSDGSDLCFLMEYMGKGSLQDSARKQLPEKHISYVARQVLEGLGYLHSMHIVHRDVKLSNLLINEDGEVKIADFGVSREVSGNACCSSYVGTCAYMSPEKLDPERYGGKYNGFAADVWALGVALLECQVGHFPLISAGERADWATLMCAICLGDPPELPEAASTEFNFMKRLN